MGSKVRIYAVEKNDGLEDLLANSVATFISQARVGTQNKDDVQKLLASLKGSAGIYSVEDLIGHDQPDLAVIVSVLASVGWNLNDDIFTPEELWAAKSTPIHKPMNHMHDSSTIIGHIVNSFAVDKVSGNEIISESDDIPNDFDIEVAGILYKGLNNPSRAQLVNQILEMAQKGEMFVSMECFFNDFDYGFLNSDTGETQVLERTETTAFLTKHLRAFNGSGEFQGYRIGRVLKDFTFGGQGFVTNPANPESVIKLAANKVAASSGFENIGLEKIVKGGVTGMDEKEIKALQEAKDALTKELDTIKAEKEAVDSELEALRAEDFTTKIEALNAKIEELTAEVTEATEMAKKTQSEKVELQKKLDETVKKAEAVECEFATMKKNIKAQERLGKLMEVREVDDSNKDATLAELAEMTDETFNIVIKYAGKTEGNSEEVNDSGDDDTDKTTAALDNTKVDENEPDLNAGNEDTQTTTSETALALAHTLVKMKEEEGGE
jgi:hypothetical protein